LTQINAVPSRNALGGQEEYQFTDSAIEPKISVYMILWAMVLDTITLTMSNACHAAGDQNP